MDEFRARVRETLGPSNKSQTLEEALQKSLDRLEDSPRKELSGKEQEDLHSKIKREISTNIADDASKWY